MNKYLKIILILNLLLIEPIRCDVFNDTLKALFVVHRHGDRATSYSYPNDPYFGNETIWPNGLGQLTEKGMRRMFSIGEYLRRTYIHFLGDSIRKIEVRSTDRDRCLESAQLLVGAAYPPTGRWVWADKNEENMENWQPIPVHTMPMPEDKLLYPFPICPEADAELSTIMNEGGGKWFNETYKDFYEFVSEKTGTKIESIYQASDIYDILMNEQGNDLQLPEWANETVLETLLKLHTAKFRLLAKTRRIQRFRVGLLLNEIMENSKRAIDSKIEERYGDDDGVKKVYFYSTHDIFLTILMTALQVDNGINPPFGSALIIELHQHENYSAVNDWDVFSSIKIYYLNETDHLNDKQNLNKGTSMMYQYYTPNCLENRTCTMRQFRSSVSDLLLDVDTYDLECGLKKPNVEQAQEKDESSEIVSKSSTSTVILVIILVAVIINLLLTLVFACRKRK